MLDMKRFRLSASVLASAVFIAVGTSLAAAQSGVVIMQDPGGGYGDALRKVMYDPFTKETGIKVVTVQEARSGPRIKAQAEAGEGAMGSYIYLRPGNQTAGRLLPG